MRAEVTMPSDHDDVPCKACVILGLSTMLWAAIVWAIFG